MTQPNRDTSGFALASHQSQALCLGTLGASGLLWPIAVWGFDSPLRFAVGWGAAAVGVWLLARARWHWQMHELGEDLISDGFGPAEAASVMLSGGIHPDIQRLLRISDTKFPEKLKLDAKSIEMGDDGAGGKKLLSWGFDCETGYLTDPSMQDKLQKTFNSGLGGIWSFRFDPTNDHFTATKKSGIPQLKFPPLWHVVKDADEAKRLYPGWQFKLGVTTGGREVGFSFDKWAHARVIGESGSGKSVAVQCWLEQFRAAGWMILLADGKGQDYVGYSTPNPDDHDLSVPGAVATGLGSSTRGMAYIAVIAMAYQIMQERQFSSEQEKVDNPSGWNMYPPVLLVLDEIKGMREKWKAELSSDESKVVDSMVTELTALGRAFRIHLVLISQDAYVDSMPSSWTSNVPLSICLGRPKDDTVRKAFERAVVPKVKQIRESMDPEAKGRGLVATVDKDSGVADAMEYQGYLSYAPGESWDNVKIPRQAAQEWPQFKQLVSDRVPRLWSRIWFRIDDKSEAQLEYEAANDEDLGYISFDMFSPTEIKRMDRVLLDMRDSSGEIRPNPAAAKYDPASRAYVCRPPAGFKKVLNPEL